jgi:histidinol-phosphatase
MSKLLKVAIEAAEAGAAHALKHFTGHSSFTYKSKNTPVTKTDIEVEEIIKKTILKSFPQAKFVGEEGGGSFNQEEFWLIDPIDGTRGFIRGLPLWGTLLAYCKNGQVLVGVSAIPAMNELMYAEKGQGAFLNNKKIHVSKIANLKDSYLNYGRPTYFTNRSALDKLIDSCNGARGIGDAYSYHLLASGRIDVNVEGRLKAWDVAPYKIIVEEAGGQVSNLEGKDWQFSDTTFMTTNKLLHNQVIKVLNVV